MQSRTLTLAFVILTSSFGGLAACGGDDGGGAPDARRVDATVPDADLTPPTTFGGDRPATLIVPTTYDPATPTPLVVALHGYFTDPEYIMAYLRLDTFAEDHGTLLIAPDGLVDPSGNYYWNSDGACCDLYDAGTDDDAYLTGLVTDIRAAYNVDPAQIYVIGHSNGAFMALSLVCNHADVFASAIALAGAVPPTCTMSEPVSVLTIHGDSDSTIPYTGGAITKNDGSTIDFPSAPDTSAALAAANGCDVATATGTPVDLVNTAGDETTVESHTGCPTGIETTLWTVPNGGHVLLFAGTVPDAWWTWLSAHPKP